MARARSRAWRRRFTRSHAFGEPVATVSQRREAAPANTTSPHALRPADAAEIDRLLGYLLPVVCANYVERVGQPPHHAHRVRFVRAPATSPEGSPPRARQFSEHLWGRVQEHGRARDHVLHDSMCLASCCSVEDVGAAAADGSGRPVRRVQSLRSHWRRKRSSMDCPWALDSASAAECDHTHRNS